MTSGDVGSYRHSSVLLVKIRTFPDLAERAFQDSEKLGRAHEYSIRVAMIG